MPQKLQIIVAGRHAQWQPWDGSECLHSLLRIAAAAPSAAESAATSEPLEEVVVSATREQLVPRVSKFVARIVVRENEEGLPRLAGAGLSAGHRSVPKGGEYVLGRISEIATAALVPLGGEDCRPNLFILVTSQPRELLQAMEKGIAPRRLAKRPPRPSTRSSQLPAQCVSGTNHRYENA